MPCQRSGMRPRQRGAEPLGCSVGWQAMEWVNIVCLVLAFYFGGVIKGATGAGAPIIAIPIISLLYDVPTAVAAFTVPNFLSNVWQSWKFRSHQVTGSFAWIFAGAGLLGAGVGTLGLAYLPPALLSVILSAIVIAYLIFRRVKPDWSLPLPVAKRVGPLVGFIAGTLQGAAGISAPVSITFLNAIKLSRSGFIAVVSMFFVAMSLVQMPLLVRYELLTLELAGYGVIGTALIFIGMPFGEWIISKFPAERFDEIIQILLFVMVLSLIFKALGAG